jgi:hypothetical protein
MKPVLGGDGPAPGHRVDRERREGLGERVAEMAADLVEGAIHVDPLVEEAIAQSERTFDADLLALQVFEQTPRPGLRLLAAARLDAHEHVGEAHGRGLAKRLGPIPHGGGELLLRNRERGGAPRLDEKLHLLHQAAPDQLVLAIEAEGAGLAHEGLLAHEAIDPVLPHRGRRGVEGLRGFVETRRPRAGLHEGQQRIALDADRRGILRPGVEEAHRTEQRGAGDQEVQGRRGEHAAERGRHRGGQHVARAQGVYQIGEL